VTVDEVVEHGIVSARQAVGGRRAGAVAAGRVTRQTGARRVGRAGGGVVGRRAGRHTAPVLVVVDAVAGARVRTVLAARPALRVARRARLRRPHHTHRIDKYLFNITDKRLQCFDAVGWAAGRASGL